jgi:hypothetical protein
MSIKKPTCGSCIFRSTSKPDYYGEIFERCIRRAPAPKDGGFSFWPSVQIDDVCGEFMNEEGFAYVEVILNEA